MSILRYIVLSFKRADEAVGLTRAPPNSAGTTCLDYTSTSVLQVWNHCSHRAERQDSRLYDTFAVRQAVSSAARSRRRAVTFILTMGPLA